MKHSILMHETQDDVGVAVRDLKVGEEVGAVTLEGEFVTTIQMVEDVPLGHKVALRDLPQDKQVIEYGRVIGGTLQAVSCGGHVHIHNLRTLRWSL